MSRAGFPDVSEVYKAVGRPTGSKDGRIAYKIMANADENKKLYTNICTVLGWTGKKGQLGWGNFLEVTSEGQLDQRSWLSISTLPTLNRDREAQGLAPIGLVFIKDV